MGARELWPVAAAIVAGFALLPAAEREYAAWSADRAAAAEQSTPVVKMAGRVVRRDGENVWVHIKGVKLRECRYAGLSAYAIDAIGVRHDANIERSDAVKERGTTKSPGAYDIGVWRVWPVQQDARMVLVAVDHLCAGVSVRSIVAEAPL